MAEVERWSTGSLLSTAAHLVEHAWNQKLAGLGLTHAGVIALDVLTPGGQLTQAALAQAVRVQDQTIGPTVARLESLGYVSRRPHASDRRSITVSITEAGAAALVDAHGLEQSILARLVIDPVRLRRELQDLIAAMGGTLPGRTKDRKRE